MKVLLHQTTHASFEMMYRISHIFHTQLSVFVLVILAADVSAVMASNGMSHRHFSLKTNPTQGVKRLDTPMTVPSRVACAQRCAGKYNGTCETFMYKPTTGLCTPGSWFSADAPLPTSDEGDLYYDAEHVEQASKPVLNCYQDNADCVELFQKKDVVYSVADQACQSKGAFLASVKTNEKLAMIQNMRNSLSSPPDCIWLGCDDIKTEGTYVWKEDGESFTKGTKPPNVFVSDEPNNWQGDEDCIGIDFTYKDKLADYPCDMPCAYVCQVHTS